MKEEGIMLLQKEEQVGQRSLGTMAGKEKVLSSSADEVALKICIAVGEGVKSSKKPIEYLAGCCFYDEKGDW